MQEVSKYIVFVCLGIALIWAIIEVFQIIKDFWCARQTFILHNAKVKEIKVGYPYRQRLDGELSGPSQTYAHFRRNGSIYLLSGESHYAALEAIKVWMDRHDDADPFIDSDDGKIKLRSDIKLPDGVVIKIEPSK